MEFDIVNVIESNPITKLSDSYNGILINKVKNVFTESQQHLFVASFYSYLNYDQKKILSLIWTLYGNG